MRSESISLGYCPKEIGEYAISWGEKFMKKFFGQKLKMTSVYKDGKALGVTPVKLNEKADISVLKAGSTVKISGISKGKGFAGGVKRWHFKGGPATHGQKNRHRAPGSIGNTTPQRVLPGRHMAGHMGMERVTYKNIKLIDIDSDKKIVLLNGGVPGAVGRRVEIVIANPSSRAKLTTGHGNANKEVIMRIKS